MLRCHLHVFRNELIAALLFLFLLPITPATAASPESVDQALEHAKQFVYDRQSNGLWEEHPGQPTAAEIASIPNSPQGGQWGGQTALAVYALLAAGESPLSDK